MRAAAVGAAVAGSQPHDRGAARLTADSDVDVHGVGEGIRPFQLLAIPSRQLHTTCAHRCARVPRKCRVILSMVLFLLKDFEIFDP